MIYISFDLETTGGKPDKSMILSLGAVAVDSLHWATIGEFSNNLAIVDSRTWDEETYDWWMTQGDALRRATSDQMDPGWVCHAFLDWIESLQRRDEEAESKDKRVAFVANPIAFDLPLLRSYMEEFTGERWKRFCAEQKAGLGGVDLPTLAMAIMNRDYTDSRRSKWPASWTPEELPHTHVAIDDARLQTHAFIKMMIELNDIHGQGQGARKIR